MNLFNLKSLQKFGLTVAALACVAPANVAAQEGHAPDKSAALDEITVTAQRREQSLQDIGVAVTAFSTDDITDMGFTQARDLAGQTPSLSIANAQSESVPIFAIRGVGLDDYNINNSSSVAIYVDDVFASSPAFLNFQLMDIKAVEVIRGPQGTLFGKNATGATPIATASSTERGLRGTPPALFAATGSWLTLAGSRRTPHPSPDLRAPGAEVSIR